MIDDRQRWDDRYRTGVHTGENPSAVLSGLAGTLPSRGRALDLGGGAGRHAIWLSQHGLSVTLADVSPVALDIAQGRATAQSTDIQLLAIDVDAEPFPRGPWDLIITVLFLWRPLFDLAPQVLAPNGKLVVIQPTVKNLERHPKPPRSFLLNEGELPLLAHGLNIEYYWEGWSLDDRHDAVLVAQKTADASRD